MKEKRKEYIILIGAVLLLDLTAILGSVLQDEFTKYMPIFVLVAACLILYVVYNICFPSPKSKEQINNIQAVKDLASDRNKKPEISEEPDFSIGFKMIAIRNMINQINRDPIWADPDFDLTEIRHAEILERNLFTNPSNTIQGSRDKICIHGNFIWINGVQFTLENIRKEFPKHAYYWGYSSDQIKEYMRYIDIIENR